MADRVTQRVAVAARGDLGRAQALAIVPGDAERPRPFSPLVARVLDLVQAVPLRHVRVHSLGGRAQLCVHEGAGAGADVPRDHALDHSVAELLDSLHVDLQLLHLSAPSDESTSLAAGSALTPRTGRSLLTLVLLLVPTSAYLLLTQPLQPPGTSIYSNRRRFCDAWQAGAAAAC